jgi:hypothetical protein
MPHIHDALDVIFNELTPDQQLQLKEAMDQYQHKCLLSFSENRSGVPFLKSDMPRVLMPREVDATAAAEKQEVMGAVQQTMEDIMAKHNTAVLNMFRQMMISVFGPGMEKVLNRMSPKGLMVRQENQVLLLMANQLKMQVLSRLCKVWEVSQSSSRTLIRQCPISLLMENWHSALLEFHLVLLTG